MYTRPMFETTTLTNFIWSVRSKKILNFFVEEAFEHLPPAFKQQSCNCIIQCSANILDFCSLQDGLALEIQYL
jgi:predicted Zn-dependent protease with MMP-like domain